MEMGGSAARQGSCSRRPLSTFWAMASWLSRLTGRKPSAPAEEECLCLEPATGGKPVRLGQMLSLGRAPGNDVTFPESEAAVSLRHASVLLVDGRVTLRDLESANGT